MTMTLQITLLYAGLLGLLLVVMSFNVLHHWARTSATGQTGDQAMRRAERVMASFVEYVPITLVLMVLIELKGAPPAIVHGLGLCLVLSRVLHAFGSNDVPGSGTLRFLGTQLAFFAIAMASLTCVFFYFLMHA